MINLIPGKSSVRPRNVYRSTPKVQSTTSSVSSIQSHLQNEQEIQSPPKYYQSNSNYYTIQYSDDQDYIHQKTPSYGAKEHNEGGESTYDPHA